MTDTQTNLVIGLLLGQLVCQIVMTVYADVQKHLFASKMERLGNLAMKAKELQENEEEEPTES